MHLTIWWRSLEDARGREGSIGGLSGLIPGLEDSGPGECWAQCRSGNGARESARDRAGDSAKRKHCECGWSKVEEDERAWEKVNELSYYECQDRRFCFGRLCATQFDSTLGKKHTKLQLIFDWRGYWVILADWNSNIELALLYAHEWLGERDLEDENQLM